MVSGAGSTADRVVFRHESGAEISNRALGSAAMHGDVYIEGCIDDECIHLNGFPYEREMRPADRSPSQIRHPWPTTTLSRCEFAELCDVAEREATRDEFDYAGSQSGHLYVAYEDDPESLGRSMDTEERIFAVPEYQTTRIGFRISHVSARGTEDGRYRVFGYNPDGPNATERAVSPRRE